MPNNPEPNELLFQVQALVDNELPADEIRPVLDRIQADPALQREYVELLRLRQMLGPGPSSRVRDEWLERAERKVSRKLWRGAGLLFFVGSYVALVGYAIYSIVASPSTPLLVSLLIGVGVLGFVFLLSNAIADRVRESKDDKYRGVMR
ncbi:MAG: anti-sigma factor family protein [Spirochaetales bacterium]